MDLITAYQLEIMLFMCGMCGILAFMTLITKTLPGKTKLILASMEISAMLLLFFDRICYVYRGNTSKLGFYMVRIGNGLVYFFLLLIPFLVTRFLGDLYKNECMLSRTPIQLTVADVLFGVGVVLVVVSQFTGLYYTFDAQNNYRRAPLHVLCYAVPFLIVLLQEWSILRFRKKIKKRSLTISMTICIALPTVSSVLQIFTYGVSLTNMVTALVVCVFYTYTLNFLSEAAERAKIHELQFYNAAKKKEAAMFEQTTAALVNAIDAKDKYTRGHSTRVAFYSKKIAKEAGLPDNVCDQVYFAALLHDIGKIGISNDIINKVGKLSEEEFGQIKLHSIVGYQILSSIRQAPFLSVGAHYHHERYDGKGYPDGLVGEDIPEIARIIAVADAYDAMTSNRSYRKSLGEEEVREELRNNAGTQFDPLFAKAMLKVMDDEKNQYKPETD
ncbi:MAG: HD-GYP domain-containing protein [Clostridia bacterium]|nr:HD-GYP domain-containing protein [Clostridia bacterium]